MKSRSQDAVRVSRQGSASLPWSGGFPRAAAALGELGDGSLNSAPGMDNSLEGDEGHGGGSPARHLSGAIQSGWDCGFRRLSEPQESLPVGGSTGSLQPSAQGPGRGSWLRTHSKLRPGTSWEDLALDHASSGELPRQGHPRQLGKLWAG